MWKVKSLANWAQFEVFTDHSSPSVQEPGMEHLKQSLHTLVVEQQDLAQKAALSTLSLGRLHQRLIIMERFFLAMTRKGVIPAQLQDPGEVEEMEHEAEEKEEGGTVKPEVPEWSEKKNVLLQAERRPTGVNRYVPQTRSKSAPSQTQRKYAFSHTYFVS